MELRALRRVVGAGLAGCVLVTLVSCVPYQKYNALEKELSRAERSNKDLIDRLGQAIAKLRKLENGELSADERDQFLREIQGLRSELDRSNSKIEELRQFTKADAERVGARLDETGGLVIQDSLLFSPGEAALKRDQLRSLDDLAQVLRTYPGELFVLEGHTDTQPVVSTAKLWKDNLNLSYHRARAVYEYLTSKAGLPEKQFQIVSYGYTDPTDEATAYTPEGMTQNRRVVVRRTGAEARIAAR